MSPFDRRRFLEISAAALLAARDLRPTPPISRPARISDESGRVRAIGANYAWDWSIADDLFHLRDSVGRLVTTSTLQPIVVVSPPGDVNSRHAALGKLASHTVQPGAVTSTIRP